MTGFLTITLDTSELTKLLEGDTLDKAAAEALGEASALLLNRMRQRFLAQTDPDGVPWDPSYAAFRRSFLGQGGGTLFDTGTLFHSIQVFEQSTPLEVAIGTDVPYGIFHQYGTIHLPKREFLGFSEDDGQLALNVMVRHIKDAL